MVLGVTRGALYLRICEPPGVLAVLSHDSVRLPCGLLLAATSAELPLTSLAPPGSAAFVVGDGAVSWTGPAGPAVMRAVREWAPARPAFGEVSASALAAVRSELARSAPRELGVDGRLLADLAAAVSEPDASIAAAMSLLGRGPGLTPSGDDVLAGFLTGAAAFGVEAAPLRKAIAALAPSRTTALSAALLWHAARGESIDEVAALAAVLTGRDPSEISHGCLIGAVRATPDRHPCADSAVSRLLSVGHSSGAALAHGLLAAAETALARREGRAA
jgi:Protein of unknown function (DUF2877)